MKEDIKCLKNTCPCANHDGLLYRRIGERLEAEIKEAREEAATRGVECEKLEQKYKVASESADWWKNKENAIAKCWSDNVVENAELQSRLDAAEKFGDEQKIAASDLFDAGIELKKELQALKEQLDKTNSNHLFQISAQDAEIEKLEERVARMGEYVGSVQQELIAVDNPVCDQQPLIDDLEKALSSYDPKWIEGKLREAGAEAVEKIRQEALNGICYCAVESGKCFRCRVRPFLTIRQPNPARENK